MSSTELSVALEKVSKTSVHKTFSPGEEPDQEIDKVHLPGLNWDSELRMQRYDVKRIQNERGTEQEIIRIGVLLTAEDRNRGCGGG